MSDNICFQNCSLMASVPNDCERLLSLLLDKSAAIRLVRENVIAEVMHRVLSVGGMRFVLGAWGRRGVCVSVAVCVSVLPRAEVV